MPAGGQAAYGVIVGVDRTTEPALGDAFPGSSPSFIARDPGGQPWAVLTLVEGTPRLASGHPLDARFAEAGRLLGVDRPNPPSDRSLELVLVWRAAGPTARPLTVFVQLLDAANRVVAQHDGQPLAGSYPTTRWQEGETVVERIRLTLPVTLPPGPYRLIAGLYDLATGRRVGVTGSDALGDAALLGTLLR